MCGRLQYVVPAVINQRTADKYHIADGVNSAQLTDGINHKHRILRAAAVQLQQFGTQTNVVTEIA